MFQIITIRKGKKICVEHRLWNSFHHIQNNVTRLHLLISKNIMPNSIVWKHKTYLNTQSLLFPCTIRKLSEILWAELSIWYTDSYLLTICMAKFSSVKKHMIDLKDHTVQNSPSAVSAIEEWVVSEFFLCSPVLKGGFGGRGWREGFWRKVLEGDWKEDLHEESVPNLKNYDTQHRILTNLGSSVHFIFGYWTRFHLDKFFRN